ncbi:MAG: hypothetical protein C0434_07940 [Xanthomonadaceae bacterium]|nr:hypothetical protein [Xanthomonadaceae bacterium]
MLTRSDAASRRFRILRPGSSQTPAAGSVRKSLRCTPNTARRRTSAQRDAPAHHRSRWRHVRHRHRRCHARRLVHRGACSRHAAGRVVRRPSADGLVPNPPSKRRLPVVEAVNWYPHHLGDYAQATAHLSMLEDAAYSRLLRWYYAEEKPIPADLRSACRIARALTEAEREAVAVVLSEFFALTPDGYRQPRADREIQAYTDKSAKASRSASARWKPKSEHSDGIANAERGALPSHSERNANASDSDANASKNDAKAMQANSQQPTYSVTDVTDAAASPPAAAVEPPPVDPVKALFDSGVALLRDSGYPDRSARELVGRWRKTATDDAVLGAIQRCRALSITDPVSWIAAALAPATRRTSPLALQANPNYEAGL